VLRVLEQLGEAEPGATQAIVRGLSAGLTHSKSPLLARLNDADSSVAARMLADMIQQARRRALDTALPLDQRVAATRSLATAPFHVTRQVVTPLLDARQPQALQVAAVQTLNRFQEDDVATILLDAWPTFSPRVRGEAAEALFARPQRLTALLAAVGDGTIRPSQLAPARVTMLLSHPDRDVRRHAEALLGTVKLARREQAVAAYRDVLSLRGDPQRGKAVFKKECSACHRLEGVGYDLGLPLQTIRNRGREGILLNVLDPNRELNPAYANYLIITDDGRSVTGMISAETATSITLHRGQGQSDTVLRRNIDELANTGLSIMPEGLEQQINKQQMADLIEYLVSLK
jgi:putative heme-binding domain-containing protein